MSLNQRIDSLNELFFDSERFAEDVVYVPNGNEANRFTIPAVVDWDNEEGNNQIRGSGRTGMNADRGRSVRATVIVELPATRVDANGDTVPMHVNERGRDRIVVQRHGTAKMVRLSVKRVVGRDTGALSVLCHIVTELAAQPMRARFG